MEKYAVPLVHLVMVKEKKMMYGDEKLESPAAAAKLISPLIGDKDREHMAVIAMDTKLKPLMVQVVAIGKINMLSCEAVDLFKGAMLCNASRVIIAHNHPSGETKPSMEDVSYWQRTKDMGKLLGIEVLDHIIVCDDGRYCSLRQYEAEEDVT